MNTKIRYRALSVHRAIQRGTIQPITIQTRTKQAGATLVVCLIMLLVITLFSSSGLNISLMQEKMAANTQNNTRTFQAAESAVGQLSTVLSLGTLDSLEQSMNRNTGLSDAVTFDVGDTQIAARYQTRYLGEVIFTNGSSMDADKSSVSLKAYRFELNGIAEMASSHARTKIDQGIEYH